MRYCDPVFFSDIFAFLDSKDRVVVGGLDIMFLIVNRVASITELKEMPLSQAVKVFWYYMESLAYGRIAR